MNLDELAKDLKGISGKKLLENLAQYIVDWKSDDRDVKELEIMVERFFGNIWLQSEEDHSKAYRTWESFSDDAIRNICGMTMNVRLYIFCLLDRFVSSKTEKERAIVYS